MGLINQLIMDFSDSKDSSCLSCDYTLLQGKCMLSHSSFSWTMFEDMFGPSDMALFSRAFSREAIVLKRAIVLTRHFSVEIAKQFFTKKYPGKRPQTVGVCVWEDIV